MKILVEYEDGSERTFSLSDLNIDPDELTLSDDAAIAERVLEALEGRGSNVEVIDDHYRDGWDSISPEDFDAAADGLEV